MRYAASRGESYVVIVGAEETSRSGPLSFSIEAREFSTTGGVSEQEPNDAVSDAQTVYTLPATIEGTLGQFGGLDRHVSAGSAVGSARLGLEMPVDSNLRNQMRPEIRLIDTNESETTSDRYAGDGSLPALYGERVPESGSWMVTLEQRTSQSGEYRLYLFTSETFTATDSEPNDSPNDTQDLGVLDTETWISATVDGRDPVDVFQFELRRDLDSLRATLENAIPAHNLRILDAPETELAASGPDQDGATDPDATANQLTAGTYFVEVEQGDGGGALDLILWLDP